WLVTARTEALSVQNTHYRYRVRSESGRQYLEVELDLGNGGSVRIFDAEGNVLWSHG
ncbi:MAG: alpha-amylase, partial [Micrococcales bacterium]